MKKILAVIAITIGLAACGDNGNPSGTPESDSTNGSLSVPDTSGGNNMTAPSDTSVNKAGMDTSNTAH